MYWLSHLIRDCSGEDMVEYGLLSAFISIVAVASIRFIGPLTKLMFHLKEQVKMAVH
jgi:Flp pilus assembly pilin Flp